MSDTGEYCRRYLEILDGWFGHKLMLSQAKAALEALNAELGASVSDNVRKNAILGARFHESSEYMEIPEEILKLRDGTKEGDAKYYDWREDHYDDVWVASSCYGGG